MRSRRRAPLLTTLLALTASAGCFLLSPDQREPTTLRLDIRTRSDDGTVAKAPCGDPQALMRGPVEDLRASATVLRNRAPEDTTPVLDLVARADLRIGALSESGERQLTGLLEFDTGPADAEFLLDVELTYTGPQGRDPLGEYAGSLVVLSGVVVHVDHLRIDQDLGGGAYAGEVRVSFGDDAHVQQLGPPETPPIRFDPEANRLTLEYGVEGVDWNGELRTVIVEMEASFAPTTIYRRERMLLPALVAGAPTVEVPLELSPVLSGTGGAGVLLAADLVGEVRARFEDGRPPSETGRLFLNRTDTTCR